VWIYPTAVIVALTFSSSGHIAVEVPHLVKVLSSDHHADTQAACATVLMIFGQYFGAEVEAAIPALLETVRNDDPLVRRMAISAILAIERDPKRIDDLANRLRLLGRDREVFEKGANEILTAIKEEHAERVESYRDSPELDMQNLVDAVKFRRGSLRTWAIRMLAEIGREASSAIPALKNALNHEDPLTRQLAAEALKKIEAPADESDRS
jgi:HEAT repeat protein